MTKEFLEQCLAEGLSLAQIGERVGRNPSTISYHLKKHGLRPVYQGKTRSRGPISELVLRTLIAEGKSIRGIAAQLDRSPSTVRYWLERYEIETHAIKTNRAKALSARARGETVVRLSCRHHGEADFYVEPQNAHYWCKRCRTERVARKRREVKDRLVREAGGRCMLCGYDLCLGALQFHHVDKKTKSFGVAMKGHTMSFEKLFAEARKCILLCANCHSEVERGVTAIPPGLLRDLWGDDGTLGFRAA
jgi:DNA-binding CsgD family transcriptional regulator